MATNEGTFTRNKIIPALEQVTGGTFYKMHGGLFSRSGIPDVIGFIGPLFVAVEVKLPTNKKGCSALQIQTIKDMRKKGVIATVVWSVADVHRLFKIDKTTGK